MLRIRYSRCLLLPALMLAASGCSAIDPPDGYVKVKEQEFYDLKAVSAHGNVIALKTRANEDKSANLEFWSQAVEYQKVDIDGMKLAKKESIKSKSGLDGVLFDFEAGEGQAKISYLVALYVTPMKIYTVEATGPTKAITEEREKLRTSMLSLRQ
jgi:hypothetical protein